MASFDLLAIAPDINTARLGYIHGPLSAYSCYRRIVVLSNDVKLWWDGTEVEATLSRVLSSVRAFVADFAFTLAYSCDALVIADKYFFEIKEFLPSCKIELLKPFQAVAYLVAYPLEIYAKIEHLFLNSAKWEKDLHLEYGENDNWEKHYANYRIAEGAALFRDGVEMTESVLAIWSYFIKRAVLKPVSIGLRFFSVGSLGVKLYYSPSTRKNLVEGCKKVQDWFAYFGEWLCYRCSKTVRSSEV